MVQGTLRMVTKDPEAAAGAVATVAGSIGITFQVLAQGLNLAVLSINLLLGLGGLYLLWLRIRKARKQAEREKDHD